MKVAVSGSSGLVGSALMALLASQGHTGTPIKRGKGATGDGGIWWDPATGEIDADAMAAMDAIVHLAGENIASGRWTEAKKEAIRKSRVDSTSRLSQSLARLRSQGRGPNIFISASAIGYYGDRGEETVNEMSPPGNSFLSRVCSDWEKATADAAQAGMRVANLRIGVVLSDQGGALAKMLPVFKLGAGGPIGNGRQWMSWIALDDLASVILHCLTNNQITGPVNAVTAEPVRNGDFGTTLGKVLHRPAFAPLPDFAARLMFGEMADELLLSSTRVEPLRLAESGFKFAYPDLTSGLESALRIGKR